jgi:hypothetical protein
MLPDEFRELLFGRVERFAAGQTDIVPLLKMPSDRIGR